jgi:peptidoglycan-associated lipoprotein
VRDRQAASRDRTRRVDPRDEHRRDGVAVERGADQRHDRITAEIRAACGIPAEDAFFAFDSAVIAWTDVAQLDAVARCFTRGPLVGRSMRLVGHADPRGAFDYNMALGLHRADSVEGYLDGRGLQRSRVTVTSRGAMDATGQDEGGWALDRRVDVQLGA